MRWLTGCNGFVDKMEDNVRERHLVVTLFEILVALQAVQVSILWLHDWLPMPPLNDVDAVRRDTTTERLVFLTLVQSVPYTIGLVFSVRDLGGPYPAWLLYWLWISYGVLFFGELRAWWVPYLIRAEPGRAARYKTLFRRTHTFLPLRNGITPNTLHTMLHVSTAATLLSLLFVST